MKSRYKAFISFFMAIAMIFSVIACEPNTPPQSGASLTVSVSEPESKLIAPDSENGGITHYVITISDGVSVNTHSDYIPKSGVYTISDLRAGIWTIGAEGYVDTTGSGDYVQVASASARKEIKEGNNSLKLSLVPAEGKSGKISITLELPESIGDGDTFGYWYAVTDMEGEAGSVIASAGSKESPVSAIAGDGLYKLELEGMEQGKYLFFISVKDSEGTIYTTIDGIGLIKDITASGYLEFTGVEAVPEIDEGLTVEDLIGDLILVSDLDGKTYNTDKDNLSIELPASYSYKYYLDGVEHLDISETAGSSEDKKSYLIDNLGSGRHVLTVVAYIPGKEIAAGTANIAVEKLGITVEEKFFNFTLNKDGESYMVAGIAAPKGIFEMPENGILEIPSSYEGKPVTAIKDSAFSGRSDISGQIIISEGITSIGNSAFMNCSSLNSIDIPDSVASIGAGAFNGCSALRNINIPENVTELESGIFQSCSSLQTIDLPNGITKIGLWAFRDCISLMDISIPGSVTEIQEAAFSGCISLENVSIQKGVATIQQNVFSNCSNLKNIDIPDSVTKIGGSVFQNCSSLEKIVIPDSVIDLGGSSFADCTSLKSIELPDGITEISYGLFQNCESLVNIHIPDNVIKIGSYAFYNCKSLKAIDIPANVSEIGYYAFKLNESLEKVTLPNDLTEIPDHCFEFCSSLIKINFPEKLKTIGYQAFWHCSILRDIDFPDGLEEISWQAFDNTSIKNVYIPESVKEISYRSIPSNNTSVWCGISEQPSEWNEDLWFIKNEKHAFWGVSRSDYDSIIAGTFDVAEPVISFSSDGNASITSDTSFAHIYYTTDGSEPDMENGTKYGAPFVAEEGITIKAVAYVGNETYSDVVEFIVPIERNVGDTVTIDGIESVILYKADAEEEWGRYILADKNHDLVWYFAGDDFVNQYEGEVYGSSSDTISSKYQYGYEWGGYGEETGINSGEIGTGLSNTNALIAMNLQPETEGWPVLWDKVQEFRAEHSDKWFVPSYNELDLICDIRNDGNLNNLSTDGSTNHFYSSSSDDFFGSHKYIDFQTASGGVNNGMSDKSGHNCRVRLCRYATDADLMN